MAKYWFHIIFLIKFFFLFVKWILTFRVLIKWNFYFRSWIWSITIITFFWIFNTIYFLIQLFLKFLNIYNTLDYKDCPLRVPLIDYDTLDDWFVFEKDTLDDYYDTLDDYKLLSGVSPFYKIGLNLWGVKLAFLDIFWADISSIASLKSVNFLKSFFWNYLFIKLIYILYWWFPFNNIIFF